MSDKPVVVRFAPSPTGQVHIGNIRVAIYNWLFARHEKGQFLLRIEDTDLARSTPEAIRTILWTMDWLGLAYDNEVFYQSEHKTDHLNAVTKLMAQGDAYIEDSVIKFRIPREATDIPEIHEIKGKKYVVYQDLVKGEMKKPLDDIKDFALVRSDGSPVFHIANVVDDITQKVTHVIRGDDHVENTFKHILLFRRLGKEVPQYAHLPMIVNDAGKPYSKRDGDAFVGDFSEKGFLADPFINYLALLGWSPASGKEFMSREELIDEFTLERCHRSPARMDARKLLHLNSKYISSMSGYDFYCLCKKYYEVFETKEAVSFAAMKAERKRLRSVCELMQSRVKKMEDIKQLEYFFATPDYQGLFTSSEEFIKNYETLNRTLIIEEFLSELERVFSSCCFEVPCLETAIAYLTETFYGMKKNSLNQSIRFIVTGTDKGAGLCETLNLIGKEQALERIKAFREFHNWVPVMPL